MYVCCHNGQVLLQSASRMPQISVLRLLYQRRVLPLVGARRGLAILAPIVCLLTYSFLQSPKVYLQIADLRTVLSASVFPKYVSKPSLRLHYTIPSLVKQICLVQNLYDKRQISGQPKPLLRLAYPISVRKVTDFEV